MCEGAQERFRLPEMRCRVLVDLSLVGGGFETSFTMNALKVIDTNMACVLLCVLFHHED